MRDGKQRRAEVRDLVAKSWNMNDVCTLSRCGRPYSNIFGPTVIGALQQPSCKKG